MAVISDDRGDLVIDVTEDESINLRNKVTDKPVEGKQNISDHVEQEPLTDTINVLFSGDNWKEKYERLKAMRDKGKILTYYGNFEILENLVITSISPSKNSSLMNAFRAEVKFKQIRVVEHEEGIYPTDDLADDPVTGNSPQVDADDETSPDKDTETEETDEESLASHLYNIVNPQEEEEG